MKLVMSVVVLLCVGAAQDLMSPTLDIIRELQKIKTMEEKLNVLYDEVRELRSKNDVHTELKSLLNSLSSVVSALNDAVNKQDQKQTETVRLLDSLKSSIQTDQQNKQRDFESLSSSLSALKSSVSDLTSSVTTLSSKQQTSDVPVTCKSGWISHKSSCFLFSSNALNWTAARDYCKAQGALLLKIQDDDREWAFLNHHTLPTSYWVGLNDQTTGQWRWADDTPYTMNKERWNTGQPDDWNQHGLGDKGEKGEDCAAITSTGKLNDSHCSNKVGFICRVQF
ncbi:asialoglycoprotein receptor 1-like [Ctenopharyngodon idella]|uniref:asialoglycoprotein receptor 1-like n=1 Tax=Ctenopharyngodon idella TaxID=7959 RepID=UPI00222ED29E|nr:asialoglycoprotein receptor 1-like [Ctenopharyngodon idella]